MLLDFVLLWRLQCQANVVVTVTVDVADAVTIVACSQCQTVVGQASQVGLESGNQNQTRRSPKASAAASEVAAAPLWLIKMFCI